MEFLYKEKNEKKLKTTTEKYKENETIQKIIIKKKKR